MTGKPYNLATEDNLVGSSQWAGWRERYTAHTPLQLHLRSLEKPMTEPDLLLKST